MSIDSGIYRITSLASQSTVRAYKPGEILFVSSTREYAGPFELFEISQAEGGYYLWNVGLKKYVHVTAPEKNIPVTISYTEDAKTIFEISKEDPKSYVIKIANKDLVWNVQPPVIPRGDIVLEPADGGETEKFGFQHAPSEPA